jgi:ABC-type Fe3+-siderophore transport system permease subunit
MSAYNEGTPSATRDRRANPMGAYVAIAGIVLFTVAVFLDWLSVDIADVADESDSVSGYEADSLIPFTAYLGIGLAIALLYAMSRAHRRQHRGLTLTTMAAGIAAFLLALSYLIDAPGVSETGGDLSPEIGVYVALVGGLLWAAGSGLFAKEIEGDDHDRVDTGYTGTGRA